MNETLFSQIQRLFERTYAQVGINLEDCLIDRSRCAQLSVLAGKSAREFALIIGTSQCAIETLLASQIADYRHALSKQVSLPAAARGLLPCVAKTAIW